jgi:HEAT repeat protein
LDALEAAGVDATEFGRFGRLYPQTFDFDAAAPVIIAWLPRVAGPRLKEAMVRSLAGQRGRRRVGATELLHEFVRPEHATNDSLRWAIANSIAVAAQHDDADAIIELLTDTRWGYARQMLCDALSRTGDPRSPSVLVSLVSDDDLAGHAISALRRTRLGRTALKSAEGRSRLEAVVNRETATPYARRAAAAVLRRTDGRP